MFGEVCISLSKLNITGNICLDLFCLQDGSKNRSGSLLLSMKDMFP